MINKLYSPWLGGIESHVKQLADQLCHATTWHVSVLCCQDKGKTSMDMVDGVSVIRSGSWGVYMSMPLSLSFFWYLWRSKADILHVHLPNPLAVIAYLLVRPKGQLIITWHADIVRQQWALKWYRPFLKLFLSKACRVITTSPNMMASSHHLQPFKHKISIVPLAIDLAHYQIDDGVNQHYQIIKRQLPSFVLFVGRLVYYKGVYVLIDAIKHGSTKLVMIGDGAERMKLEQYIAQASCQDTVTLLPPQPFDRLCAYLAACCCLVLPSPPFKQKNGKTRSKR